MPVIGLTVLLVLRDLRVFHGRITGKCRLVQSAIQALIALIWLFSTSAWAAGGYVFDAAGEVSAAVGKNAERSISINDAIVPDTIINTGEKSYAVLKFDDGQVVTLQSNSIFHVRKYQFNPKRSAQNNAVFSMLKGGMRFITGLIGQRNKKAFRLATPNATIGIRGTDFMVAMVDGVVYGQVLSGGIRMTNDAGTAVITAGQALAVSTAKSAPTRISLADLPAGTFSQLETISTQPSARIPAPANGAVSDIPSAAAGMSATAFPPAAPAAIPITALGEGAAANGIIAGASVSDKPADNPANAPKANMPSKPAVNYLAPREAAGLPYFATVAPSSAASDAALATATINDTAAAEISRNEAAAGLFGKHNFTTTGIATGEICAFCHTPQGVESRVVSPLWNRSLSTLSHYNAFSTLGSSLAAWSGSVSIACLSCHDGTQAPNVIINTPAKDGTGSDSINGTKTDSSQFLKGHHPVGMMYAGGGPNQNMPGAPFKLDDFRSTSHSGSDTGTVWWIEKGGNGRQKTDLLLFTRTETSNNQTLSRPYVECASCHDPHSIVTPTFLRVDNTMGSSLCLTCHAK